MRPFFSIITPTVQRESLIRCFKSVLSQTFDSWEMIIQVDSDTIDEQLFSRISPTRKIWVEECGLRHNNYGNSCRHKAWERATGEWIWYLDDDNYLSDTRILEDMASALEGIEEPFAIFPILRHGRLFFYDPPGCCYVDTMQMVVKREIGRWPNIVAREADGNFCDELKAAHPYKSFPGFRCVGVMEYSSNGI